MFQDVASSTVRRVVLVVLDGLRPDAVPRFGLAQVARLARAGSSTFRATTVEPSVTMCAMATLLTGAAPARHGLQSDRVFIPRPRGALHPVPKELARHSMPTSAYITQVPFLFTGIAHRIASLLGVSESRFTGASALDVLAAARRSIEDQQRGLILMHWPDADHAGHEHGWMSPEYGMACGRLDEALGRLVRQVDLVDPDTLVIAVADHGGGGASLKKHDSAHPFDRTIPVILAGGAVLPGDLGPGVTLLDVPATVLWSLGLPVPESYGGRPLLQAFNRLPVAA